MKRLNVEQVKWLHGEVIKVSGGGDGVRDEGILESAVESPFQSFGGQELYPTLIEKAARLGYSLIMNHAFVDGNKRIGLHAMLVFLDLNGVEVEYEDEDLIKTIFELASGRKKYESLLSWITEHVA